VSGVKIKCKMDDSIQNGTLALRTHYNFFIVQSVIKKQTISQCARRQMKIQNTCVLQACGNFIFRSQLFGKVRKREKMTVTSPNYQNCN